MHLSGSLSPVTSLQLLAVFVCAPHKMKHYNKCLCLLCCSISRSDSLYDVTERRYPTDMSLTHCMVMLVTVTVYWGRSVCALLFHYVWKCTFSLLCCIVVHTHTHTQMLCNHTCMHCVIIFTCLLSV